jgi:hypothetical protein
MDANRRHYEHLLFLAARTVKAVYPRANIFALCRGFDTKRWHHHGVPIPEDHIVMMIIEAEKRLWRDEQWRLRQRRLQRDIDGQENLGQAYQ